jgi:hypothetical protein
METELAIQQESLKLSVSTCDEKQYSTIDVENEPVYSVKLDFDMSLGEFYKDEDFSGEMTLGSNLSNPKGRCTFLILCLCGANFLLNAAYGV